MPTIMDKVYNAKLKLMTKELLFFGVCNGKFQWKVYQFDKALNAEAMVAWNTENMNELKNGDIHFNEELVKLDDYTHTHLCYAACHELLHVLNKHGLRMSYVFNKYKIPREHAMMVWNFACDHVIEIFLRDNLKNIVTPHKQKYNIIPDLEKQIPHATTEEACDWIYTNMKDNFLTIQDNGDGTASIKDLHGNTIATISLDVEEQALTGDAEKDQKIRDQNNQFISQIRAIHENMKNRGTIPGGLSEYFDKLLKVELPWDQLVEQAIKSNVIMVPDDRSWRIPNKYYRPLGMLLPGQSMTEEKDAVGTLYIHVDSSGSISNNELMKFAYIITKFMRYFEKIIVITCDSQIQDTKEFDKDNINEFLNYLKNEGFKGRGGTSHRPVFDYIEKEYKNDSDEMSMVISLTDMESDVQSIYQGYDWIKNNIPLLFVISGKAIVLPDNKFGDIKQIVINN